MARFDYYRGSTFEVPHTDVVALIGNNFPDHELKYANPKLGYQEAVKFMLGDTRIAEIWWGGNKGVLLTTSNRHAQQVADLIPAHWDFHPTRVDACVDIVEQGGFDAFAKAAIAFAKENNLVTNCQGDWAQAHKGRTLYIGSPYSAYQLVIYEKGKQLGTDPNWYRVEAKAMPSKAPQKRKVAEMSPDDIFGCSRWAIKFFDSIGWKKLKQTSIGNVWEPTNDEKAIRSLVKQWYSTMNNLVDSRLSGDWDRLGGAILEIRKTMDDDPLAPLPDFSDEA